jgi:hypothetical protein
VDWIEFLRSEGGNLLNFIQNGPYVGFGVGGVLLILFMWIGGILRIQRYGERLLRSLQESTPERIQVTPRWDGFEAKIIHPTAPFQTLVVTYTSPWPINPLAALAAIFGPGGRLTIQAGFYGTPRAELAWMRRSVPGQAFRQETNVSAWVHRKLAVTGGEYATRGSRVERLSRTFAEFYIRFNPALLRVCIQQEMEPQLEVVVSMSSLPVETIPHLMASTWSLGQAAAPLPK